MIEHVTARLRGEYLYRTRDGSILRSLSIEMVEDSGYTTQLVVVDSETYESGVSLHLYWNTFQKRPRVIQHWDTNQEEFIPGGLDVVEIL